MRIIAALQIMGSEKAVKTQNFEERYYLGDPLNIIRILNTKGAQEIAVMDIQASQTGKIDYEEIARLSSETSVPFLYGGGISSTTDIRKLAGLGVERFMISRFLDENQKVVENLVAQLGSSSVSISLDIEQIEVIDREVVMTLRRYPNRKILGRDILERIRELGVGEVVVRPMWLDGSDGSASLRSYAQIFNNGSFESISDKVRILCGTGIRNLDVASEIYKLTQVDGFVVGSMVSLTKSGGVLTSYPAGYSVL
jgi:cyclase